MNWWLAASLLLLVSACATTNPPGNQAITAVDESSGYRRLGETAADSMGNTLVFLAFSGGGTRAAALSYGVMQELRDTLVVSDGAATPLLGEVDAISSVSGGSFTAAYYGLHREGLFTDFEDDFLRKDVQGALINRMINPFLWFGRAVSGENRAEIAIDYYDREVFKGATFNDIAAQGPPYIDINATDLTTGLRFTFSQDLFDLICTDLGSYQVARAVAASSGVPVVFPTVVLQNHANQCDISDTWEWRALASAETEREAQAAMIEGLKSYRNAEQRPYIHLVDGGISDNLGLRTMIDRVDGLGEQHFHLLAEKGIRDILVILVNAQVTRTRQIEETPEQPSANTTMSAYISSQNELYNRETKDRLRGQLDQLRAKIEQNELDMGVFFSEVSFADVEEERVRLFLNNMPTSLALEDEELDRLIISGRVLLRHDPEFVAFKARRGASLAPGAVSDEDVCRVFGQRDCLPQSGPAPAGEERP